MKLLVGVWTGGLAIGFTQVGAVWQTYLILGITALLFYLMGFEDGAE